MTRNVVAFVVLTAVLAGAQTVEWLHRYPGYGPSGAQGIAVDGSGNAYVAGTGAYPGRSRDAMTIKYTNTGDTAWVRYYDGGANFYDDIYALAIDGAGNVYVTGQCMVVSGNREIVTIKYSSAGVEEWVAICAGADGDDDAGHDIEVDDSGYVYVTGYIYSSSTSADWMTIKYNNSGDTMWTACYNSPGNSADQANALALDGSGNVYVTGYAYMSPESYNYATIKYNADGEQQWCALHNGALGNADDKAYDIAYRGGYIYVTGESEDANYNPDYLTIKYNDSGDTVWTRRYDGPGQYSDVAYALAVDNNSNVYITGGSDGATSARDYGTVKYTGAGAWQWTAHYDGPASATDEAYAIAVDDAGNVYVTGRSYANEPYTPEFDYLTIKYDASGNEQWVARYDGTGHSNDKALAITIDNASYVYITGESSGTTSYEDVVTIKYSTTGIAEDAGYAALDTRCGLTISPNPFHHSTQIRYTIQDARYLITNPAVCIYDAGGRLVRSYDLASCIVDHGSTISWDGTDQANRQLGSGVYFVRLTAGGREATERLILIR